MHELFCPWDAPTFLIFSTNVPSLFYYSHGVAIVSALLLGLFVFLKDRKALLGKILLTISVLFSLWVFLDISIWATNSPSFVMFWWSVIILIEVLIYVFSIYFLQVFIDGRDVSFKKKLCIGLLLSPVIFFLPTHYNLSGIELESCLAVESFIPIYYTYFFEVFIAILLLHFSFTRFRTVTTLKKRNEIVLITVGILLFLLAFSYGNIIGSITTDWELAQYGLFGMPVFIGFLAYMIVKFKTFDIKLLGAQALIFSLIVIIGSEFFFIHTNINRVLTAITLVITGAIGINLIRSVKKEVALRERIEKQEKELEKINARLTELDQLKSEFVSLATHQIRGPLTAIKGYASMMIQGDLGTIPDNLKDTIHTIYDSSTALTCVVQDFLDISRIEQGRMKYDFSIFDLGKLVYDVAQELDPTIVRKGLKIKLDIEKNLVVNADIGKLRQVFENLIDNAIKYSPKGTIIVTAKRTEEKMAQVSIKDNGVGIKAETLPKLFQKFSRAEDASKANILGTGLGLYVARQLITALKGAISAQSEGEGKGSTFVVELPLKV